MKLMFPSMMIFMFYKNFKSYIILLSFLIFILFLKSPKWTPMLMNEYIFNDTFSTLLSILSIFTVILISSSSNSFKLNNILVSSILMLLICLFLSNNLLWFYIFFELILIPTLLLISKLGKQPERLKASIYLIMYTSITSLPFLISIILLNPLTSFYFMNISTMKINFFIWMILALLVKTPMFFTHLWLPKAHVEAPVEGSMMLAAILLKMGGFGLIRILPFINPYLNYLTLLIISISTVGAFLTSLNCLRQKDMKSLIAYSSITHMALSLIGLMLTTSPGLSGSFLMMIAHGLSSSALFLLANDYYMKCHSRNITSMKGLFSTSPNTSFWWFIFISINVSAPPFINFFSEIMIFSSMIIWSINLIFFIFIYSISTTSFSILLFSNIYHNKPEMLVFNPSKNKFFMILLLHFIPLIMISTNLNLAM